jgi:hypothetical protein
VAGKRKTPKPIGGGWYLLDDGRKIQGRDAAYSALGLDPSTNGNRKSDAAKQRRRKSNVAERRQLVAALLVQRVPLREIASSVGAAVGTVHSDVAAIRDEWRESALRDIGDYVIDELATLENDEYRLRMRYQSAVGDDVKMRIYDRITRTMERRAQLLGLDAPTVRRVVLTAEAQDEFGGERVVFRSGKSGTPGYLEALKAAQGHPALKVVES